MTQNTQSDQQFDIQTDERRDNVSNEGGGVPLRTGWLKGKITFSLQSWCVIGASWRFKGPPAALNSRVRF